MIAPDLEISESCLRRWMDIAEVDEGRKEGLSSDERAELVRLRGENATLPMEKGISTTTTTTGRTVASGPDTLQTTTSENQPGT